MTVAEPPVQISLQRILVATNFSERSERALLTALGIAHRHGAELHLLHAVPAEGYGVTGVGMLGAAHFARRRMQRLESKLLENGSLDGIRYQLSVEKGEILPVVSRILEEESIDLAVLGTHGRVGVGKLLLGSVAEKIFRQALCPVLTVGPNFQSHSPFTPRPKSILFSTDFSPQSEHAFPYAVFLARESRARLTILNVMKESGSEAGDHNDRARRYAMARLEELLADAEDLDCESMVETGNPTKTILKVADGRDVDLIVLGVRPASLPNRLGWSTAYGVVREAHCPVLTVRSGG